MQNLRLLIAAFALSVAPLAPAVEVDWRFPIGLSYANGVYDVEDAIEKNSFVEIETVVPVGLSFHPYVEFSDIGLGIGASVGPTMLGVGDFTFYSIPVGADVRYTLFNKGNISPYVRAGFRYPIAGGDFLSTGSPGFFGAAGFEFFRGKNGVALGLEAGYDSSEVEVDIPGGHEDVKPVEFMISIYAVF